MNDDIERPAGTGFDGDQTYWIKGLHLLHAEQATTATDADGTQPTRSDK